jgi:hypothetical protein
VTKGEADLGKKSREHRPTSPSVSASGLLTLRHPSFPLIFSALCSLLLQNTCSYFKPNRDYWSATRLLTSRSPGLSAQPTAPFTPTPLIEPLDLLLLLFSSCHLILYSQYTTYTMSASPERQAGSAAATPDREEPEKSRDTNCWR